MCLCLSRASATTPTSPEHRLRADGDGTLTVNGDREGIPGAAHITALAAPDIESTMHMRNDVRGDSILSNWDSSAACFPPGHLPYSNRARNIAALFNLPRSAKITLYARCTMADSIRVSLPTSGDEQELDMDPPEESRSTASGPGDTQHRPQKRRRIPVACGACRSKKSRVSVFFRFCPIPY